MRRPSLALALLPFLLGAPAACGKNKTGAPNTTALHVPGTPHTDEVLAAWRNASLAPERFSYAQPPPNTATYCEHGTVRGVDTTICEYESDQALARGVQQLRDGWARIDAHTGVVLRAKRTTMAAVDRERREPSGKTINEMAKIFRKL